MNVKELRLQSFSNSKMTQRENFDDSLARIRQAVLGMGGQVAEMIRLACDAACQSNPELTQRVVDLDNRVDELENEIVESVVVATMRHQPVAGDLRFLAATLGVVGEIEKAGDDAVKLARRAQKLTGQFPAELKLDLASQGELTRVAFTKAMKLYIEYSDELCDEVIQFDQEIDDAFKQARGVVLDLLQRDATNARHMIRTIDAFHSLEHAADHAVEIAKRLRKHYQTHRSTATPA